MQKHTRSVIPWPVPAPATPVCIIERGNPLGLAPDDISTLYIYHWPGSEYSNSRSPADPFVLGG